MRPPAHAMSSRAYYRGRYLEEQQATQQSVAERKYNGRVGPRRKERFEAERLHTNTIELIEANDGQK